MRRLFFFVVVLLVPVLGSPAFATPTRWELSNVTLGDGSRVVGSFYYDADTNTWSRLAITTSGGSILPAASGWQFNTLYSGGLRNDGTRSGFIAVYPTGADLTGAKALVLMSTNSQYLTNAGGTISLDMFRAGTCGNSYCSYLDGQSPSSLTGVGAFTSGVWVSANGPIGPNVVSISSLWFDAGISSTMYGCSTDGLFKTTDRGASWLRVNLPAGTWCRSLAVDPVHANVLYANVMDGQTRYVGLEKSVDGGTTWGAIDVYASTVAIAADSSAVYALGSPLRRSSDGGASWATLPSLPSGAQTSLFCIDDQTPTTLYLGTGSASGGGAGVYKSINAGASWLGPYASGLDTVTTRTIQFITASHGTVYAGTAGGVFVSTTGGTSWVGPATGTADRWVNSVAVDPQNPNTMFAAARNGILKSIDGGASWTALAGWGLSAATMVRVEPAGLHAVYALSSGVVWTSTDGGVSWERRGNGLQNTEVWSMAFDPHGRLFAGTNGNVFSLEWPSGTWQSRASRLGSIWQIAFAPSVPDLIYAGDFCNGVRRSTDGGATWSLLTNGMTVKCVEGIVADPTAPATVYASTNDGLYKSVNSGDLWVPINNGTQPTTGGRRDFQALAMDPTTPTTLYAGGVVPNYGVYKTIDGGANWTVTAPLPSTTGYESYVWKVIVDPANPSSVYVSADGVYKTTDGGESWSLLGLAGESVRALLLDPITPNVLYAGLEFDNRVYRSLDRGLTWEPIGAGLPLVAVISLTMDPAGNTLFAGTDGGGVYYLPIPRNQPPTAEAGPNRTVLVGETVSFDGSGSKDSDGTFVSWQWGFGDGTAASGSAVTHVYAAPGTFTATLTVTDDDGATGSDTATVVVQTLSQGVGSLTDLVASYNIQQGVSTSLDAKLLNAQDALNAVNAGQRQDAANKLLAFINAVEAQRGKQLTDQQADALIAQTNRILALL